MGKDKKPSPNRDVKKPLSKRQVLTKKELAREPDLSGSLKPKIPEGQKTVEEIRELKAKETKFECGWAPSGKANISFNHTFAGKVFKYDLELRDRIFTLDDKLPNADKIRFRAALKDNGFIDITSVKAGVYFHKEKVSYIYTAIHPEHCEKNPVNGSISLLLFDDDNKPMLYKKGPKAGQQISNQVNIIHGRVETDNAMVYEALIKAGFYSGTKREKEE